MFDKLINLHFQKGAFLILTFDHFEQICRLVIGVCDAAAPKIETTDPYIIARFSISETIPKIIIFH